MSTSGIKQRKSLNGYHQRKHKSRARTYVPHNGQLPTAAVLEAIGAPADLVAQVQTWHDLKVAERDHARKAATAHAAAEASALDYRRKVRDAIVNGGDEDKVKDETAKQKAIATTHAEFSDDARSERERLGYTLGPQLEAAAPALFDATEAEITKAAGVLIEALAGIGATWAEYSAAFQLRQWLSYVALNGGMVGVYHGPAKPPAAVRDALDALDDETRALDRLKSDEDEVRTYRETE